MSYESFASRALSDLDAAHARIAAKGALAIEDGKPETARDTIKVLANLDRLRELVRRDVEGAE